MRRISSIVPLLALGPALLLAAGPRPAVAETFRLIAPDGTVHFTNTPTDPRYQRLGVVPPVSGTSAGWLRLPRPDLTPYEPEIRAAAGRYGVADQLIRAVIRVESGFNPRAVSRKGARGLMQLMPGTASLLGVRDAFDPRQNIDGGVRHLRQLMDRFGSHLPHVLAAYNAGEQAVLTYGGIPPYPETQDYVARILGLLGEPSRAALPRATFRRVDAEGTVIYTNIPPRPPL